MFDNTIKTQGHAMNLNLTCKLLLALGILVALTFSRLEAADSTETNQAKPFPLDKVTRYLADHDQGTALQNSRTEKELVGKIYRGVMTVQDVEEIDKDIIIKSTSTSFPNGNKMHFRLHDAALKEQATQIRKGDRIQITAMLDRFWNCKSGYINVSDTYIAEFKDVQGFDVQPQSQTEPKR